jgi:hydrogenase maturation protein HypF
VNLPRSHGDALEERTPPEGRTPERRQLRLRGLVQGVGFRPHVYRTAQRHGVRGYVRNTGEGVEILAEGLELDRFEASLERELPPLARIDSLERKRLGGGPEHAGFEILPTPGGSGGRAAIPADLDLCADCLRELFDPQDRRYRYPFIACSQCGPRLSMTRRLPYDRASTSMNDFPLCECCRSEYEDPASRRFHAEPLACAECGPSLSHPLSAVANAIASGAIVALKTVGGFHLLCNARNADAVARLRQRKRRDGKPFAVLVSSSASAERYVLLDADARRALESRSRPVLVLDRREGGDKLSDALTPGLETLGVALPANAIQYLLLHALLGEPDDSAWLDAPNDLALVMTSANVSGEPLVTDGKEAREKLGDVADLIVDHDREIAQRVDDSVLRATGGPPFLIRRARGYAPAPIPLGDDGPCVLATGAHLKNTMTLAAGDEAVLSQHLGDLDAPSAIEAQARTAELLLATMAEPPATIACDWHRDYASTRLAETLAAELAVPVIRVQHHHAHVAAVLAEHGVAGPALGLALDGHGLGERGESWGGELLRVDGARFDRLGSFSPLEAPGGDIAAREPWRLATAWLHARRGTQAAQAHFAQLPLVTPLCQLLDNSPAPRTSSAGRLFDLAAALLGVVTHSAFEADAAMRLEGLARQPCSLTDGYELRDGILDFTPLLESLSGERDAIAGAERFHGTLVDGLTALIVDAAARSGLDTVALSGGCLLNVHLRRLLPARLAALGLRPLLATLAPANDGGISLGQAWVARAALANEPLGEH